jgi:hypothetical protein
MATNATPLLSTNAVVQGTVIMGITNSAGQGEGIHVTTAQAAPDLIGVFEIAFQVPADAATGNNVAFSIGVIPVGGGANSTPFYSATVQIPVE